jgi:hypothetical protein
LQQAIRHAMERRTENFLFFGESLLNDMSADAKQAKGVLSDASDNFFRVQDRLARVWHCI